LRNTAVVYLLTYVLSFSRYQQMSARSTSTAKVENISKDLDGGQETFIRGWSIPKGWTHHIVMPADISALLTANRQFLTHLGGFRNWKKATYKEGEFAVHSKSERHRRAMIAWRDNERAVKTNATLENVLNKEHNKLIAENRKG